MTWVKLDDNFPTHPRVVGLSDRTFRTHVTALCYCAKYLTDGHVPTSALRAIGPRRSAVELEEAGLWSKTDHGWMIRDFLDYNPSREDVETQRTRKREAGSRGAEIRWQKP